MSSSELAGAFQRAYSETTKNTLTESSTSIVVRSEQQFHTHDLFRTTQRRHIYEALKSGTEETSRFGIHCSEIDIKDRYGEYIGFLDLREYFNKSPLAFALLVEPGSIREDPNAFVIRGDYGPLFGAHSFRSTVYSMQDPKTAGAMCAQTCIIMTLGMLGDRKSEIKGSFTVAYLGHLTRLAGERKKQDDKGKPDKDKRPFEKFVEEIRTEINTTSDSQFDSFTVGGLNPKEMRDVLRQCNVASEVVDFKHENSLPNATCSSSEREAMRIIEANVRARFPVILSVNGWRWVTGESCPDDEEPVGHAVTIVGLRTNVSGEAIGLIVHDPASQPFLERSSHKCLQAAREHRVRLGDTGELKIGNKYSLVVATEKSVEFHAHECVEWLKKDNRERVKFARFYCCQQNTNYRIFAANGRSVFRILAPEVAQQDHVKLFIDRKFSEIGRVWCVITYEDGHLHTAWLFDALARLEHFALRIVKTVDGYEATVFNDEGKQETYPL